MEPELRFFADFFTVDVIFFAAFFLAFFEPKTMKRMITITAAAAITTMSQRGIGKLLEEAAFTEIL